MSQSGSDTFDFIVCGSGAGGLSAAVFAALKGWKVLLLESSDYVGGTTALSGGTTWAPLSAIGREVNADDSLEKVEAFLDSTVGAASDKAIRRAFLEHAATAVETLHNETRMKFRPCPKHPDYIWSGVNATLNGRAIEPVPYRTVEMGKLREMVRPPIPEFTVLGGMQIDRVDIRNLLDRYKSLNSFIYVGKLVTTYVLDRLRFGRHARLVMGQALIGRLLHSASELGVKVVTQAKVESLINQDGRVSGVVYQHQGQTLEASSRFGVLMATGGFNGSKALRERFYEKTMTDLSPANSENIGLMHPIAESHGARYGTTDLHPSFYAPVSTHTRDDGSVAVYPHFVFDRSKPGTLCVNEQGERFLNETVSYHDFGSEVLRQERGQQSVWLIADHQAIQKYGLGLLRPGGDNPAPLIRDGYLKTADSIDQLAAAIQVPKVQLSNTLNRFNALASQGEDSEFGRGSTPYQQHNGDPENRPNPTLRPLTGPFYAVELKIGSIGTSKGFVGNRFAQLVDANDQPIEGLYAAGNDLQSIMGGVYPGPGITIGPAITFAYIAVKHAAGELS